MLAISLWIGVWALGFDAPSRAPRGETPRLIVLLAIDQLPSWVLEAAWPHLGEDGFKRLEREGIFFEDCAYAHACTETGPGHATLSTGVPASVHGIVANKWFDGANGNDVYCVETPAGKGPGWLLAPTLGDRLKSKHAAAKVVSVSWKDRAAILLGGKGADLVVWISEKEGKERCQGTFSGDPLVLAWISVEAYLSGLRDRKAEWTLRGPTEAYDGLRDSRGPEREVKPRDRTFPHELGVRPDEGAAAGEDPAAIPTEDFMRLVMASPFGNELVDDLARRSVDRLGLGSDEVPDLLLVSYSSNDRVGHFYGPNSVEARDMLLRTDDLVAGFLRFLDERVGAGRYLFLLSADHGVAPIPEIVSEDTGLPALRVDLEQMRHSINEELQALAPPHGVVVTRAMNNSLYLAPEISKDPAALQEVSDAARRIPGVDRTYTQADLLSAREATDPIARALGFAFHPGRSGQILLVLEPFSVELTDDNRGDAAVHGSPYPYDREVPFLAMGPGLKAGSRERSPVSPGIGVVIACRALGLETPAGALDAFPAGAAADPK